VGGVVGVNSTLGILGPNINFVNFASGVPSLQNKIEEISVFSTGPEVKQVLHAQKKSVQGPPRRGTGAVAVLLPGEGSRSSWREDSGQTRSRGQAGPRAPRHQSGRCR
jgi:hypothetical protein